MPPSVPSVTQTQPEAASPGAPQGCPLVLMVAWCEHDPSRIGQIMDPGRTSVCVGRNYRAADSAPLVRPHDAAVRGPLSNPRLSKRHVHLVRTGADTIELSPCKAEARVQVNGADVTGTTPVKAGDRILLAGSVLLWACRRPWIEDVPTEWRHRFGEADELGIVGESEAAYDLRRRVRRFGPLGDHVLILGETGVGKELVAQGLFACSSKRDGPWVSVSAANLPETLCEAELFGNRANYPQAGMPERAGLLGEAHGGTFFLDEIGVLPQSLQARLLRFMDCGEYRRLGDVGTQKSVTRMIAATNSAVEALKHDLSPRFGLTIEVPSIAERRMDIPFLVRHLAKRRREQAEHFDERGEPRIACSLVEALMCAELPGNVRQIKQVVTRAMANGMPGEPVALSADGGIPPAGITPHAAYRNPDDIPRHEVVQAMEANPGDLDAAALAVGLRSRHQLFRLRRRLNLV